MRFAADLDIVFNAPELFGLLTTAAVDKGHEVFLYSANPRTRTVGDLVGVLEGIIRHGMVFSELRIEKVDGPSAAEEPTLDPELCVERIPE